MIDSSALNREDAYQLYAAERPMIDDDEAHPAFLSGYALAWSQSTQGDGEWDPKECY